MSKKVPENTASTVVSFLFNLWRISPVMTFSMIFVQVIFAVLTTTIAPLFVSKLLTQVSDGSASLQHSTGLLIGYAAILIVGEVVAIRITIILAYFAESRMQAKIASQVLEHLTKRSTGYHANNMSGGMVSNANKLNSSIERFWDMIAFSAVGIVTTIVAVCIALGFIFWQYGIALAVLSIIIIFVMIRLQTTVAPKSKLVAERSSASTAFFADVISNISTVKAFGTEKQELAEYNERIGSWRAATISEMKSVLIITGSFGAMMTIMNILAFVAAIVATQYHIANIGTIYLVISYTLNVVAQLWGVSGLTRGYLRIIGDASPMIQTLAEPYELTDNDDAKPLKVTQGSVTFDNVTFAHDAEEEALFRNFTLSIAPGEHIGLVGRSGSGKTTLTRLLLRFSDLDDGTIMIDGQDISALRQDDLRKHIAYVPQEPALFHRSIADNIAYGKEDATEDEIIEAARKANAYEFIQKLPDGMQTLVGERGVKLSGGQRQRIAIARAILKDAPILLLDEATSALDSESESLIQEALAKLMKGRTSIVIAHRLSTIAGLDRIIVLDDGKIVEEGTHKALSHAGGTYAKLWAHQSGGFIEE
jgi:ATP-binding cassette subfamily B protein